MRIARLKASAMTIGTLGMLTASTALAQPAPFAPKPFSDVKESHPSYEAIEYLRERSILRGYPDGTFRPDQRISRAEFTMMMTNPFFLSGEQINNCVLANTTESTNTVFFPDVQADAWYADAVCAAKLRDLVHGYPNGEFLPGHTIILAEAAKMAARVFVINARQEDSTDDRWYTAYILALGERNAIPASLKTLTQPVTRAEMAEILYRLKLQITDKSFTSSTTILQSQH